MSGPTRHVRDLVLERAGGRCERCGAWAEDTGQQHHRQPRSMGGSTAAHINLPSNLLLLCALPDGGCHAWVEANRSVAYAQGLLVRRPFMPAETPVSLGRGRVLLTDDGRYVGAVAA